MINDTVADMLTRIRNAYASEKTSVEVPYSKINKNIADVLVKSKFITSAKVFKHKGKVYKGLNIELKYKKDGKPAIDKVERISKPSLRVYRKAKELELVLGGLGMYVVSTPRGIMTSKEAYRKKLGGELICRVY